MSEISSNHRPVLSPEQEIMEQIEGSLGLTEDDLSEGLNGPVVFAKIVTADTAAVAMGGFSYPYQHTCTFEASKGFSEAAEHLKLHNPSATRQEVC